MTSSPKLDLVDIFATAPQSHEVSGGRYTEMVADVARWSEAAGCTGILVYADNRLVDPWLVAQLIIQHTHTLSPLVAVQPVYMHPYSVAKMVASLGTLHQRRLHLNMVAGGFRNDLFALNDPTPHDARYERLFEYTRILMALLRDETLSFEGRHYCTKGLRLTPAIPSELVPPVFLSGSSDAGLQTARKLGATAIKYPKPPSECVIEQNDDGPSGIRIGIIARSSDAAAWQTAFERFPEDRKGQLAHKLATKVSDSAWHNQLSMLGQALDNEHDWRRSPYWLRPFENYQTFCPYLVGSYETVAEELSTYITCGFDTFILDIPPNESELYHTTRCFEIAEQAVQVHPAPETNAVEPT